MKMLMHVKLPHDKFNACVKDGSAGPNLGTRTQFLEGQIE